MDFSQEFYPVNRTSPPVLESAFKIAISSAVMVVAIIGNIVVMLTVSLNKRMRSTTNCYIFNLAVADLMVILTCTWVDLVDNLNDVWVLGHFFCVLTTFMQVLSLVSSILTLTLISCDRFFGIVFAIKARLTKRRPRTFIILVWIVSLLVAAPLLFSRKQYVRPWLDHVEIWCGDDWPKVYSFDPLTNQTEYRRYWRNVYYTSVSVVMFFFPILLMSIAYSIIIYKLWSHRTPGETTPRLDGQVGIRHKKRVVKMLLVILFLFIVCWLPFQILLLYSEHRSDQHLPLPDWFQTTNYFANVLSYANSAINPIVYFCFNANFRQGAKETLACRKPSRRGDDSNNYQNACLRTRSNQLTQSVRLVEV